MRCRLIVNPRSGPWDVDHELPAVRYHLEEHGWKTSLYKTEQPGEATALATQAAREEADAVFVVGGDGTINEVVNGLAESPVALGVLPGGTGNVWAKALGLPTRSPLHLLPLVDSVRMLVPGSSRRIDLGKANGRYFLQWTGLGLDAAVTYAMEPRTRRQRRLGALAYLVAGVSTAAHLAGTRTRIWIDGKRIYRRSILIVVSNSRIYSAGLTMATDARLDDGFLDVDVFAGTGFGASMRTALSVITGLHVRDPRHSVYRGRSIHIESDKPLAVHIDGEPFGAAPLDCQVIPKSLTVLLPLHPRAELFAD